MKVAIIGATGAVGRVMIAEVEALFGGSIEPIFLASPRSAGKKIVYGGQEKQVESFDLKKISQCKYALMSAGGDFSRQWSPAIADAGCTVIDNSSAWRMSDSAPLVVPEVNANVLDGFSGGIIANPNCSTIQMVVSLKPLADRFGLTAVNVATYQSVSGAGQKGIDELLRQDDPAALPSLFPALIGRNVIPGIGAINATGETQEEEKMVRETRKIMSQPELMVLATTVRVPTFTCHAEAIVAHLATEVTQQQVYEAFREQSGLICEESLHYDEIPNPINTANKREVYVSRVRLPYQQSKSNVVQYWNVADNLRKGAATNAVQILQTLIGA